MKPLADYSHIRGFNYTPSYAQNDLDFWNNYRHDVVDREMGYAQRLGLNSARIFLAYKAYLRDPRQFQENLRDFVQTAWAHGISTTPILYCGGPFYPDFVEEEAHDGLPAIPSILKPENYHLADEFFDDVYQAVGSEPGLLFWDIANEPGYHTPNFVTFYPEEPEFRHLLDPKPQDMEVFRAKQESVWAFIRHAIAHVREKDPVNALGVGNTYAYEIEPSQTAPLVDVLIFHNYFETRKRVRDECEIMKRLSQKYNKPVVNNECCCLCRSNPYDMELEILAEYGFGFYVFELMIGQSIWRKVHGICYPDGTVRDPSIVAAVQGFFRNRGPSAIPEDVNEEGSAHLAIRLATETLAKTADRSRRHMERENAELLLEAAEYIANLLEAGQYVPMRVPPTARIEAYRRQEHPNLDEIRTWLYQLVQQLLEVCCILGSGESNSRI